MTGSISPPNRVATALLLVDLDQSAGVSSRDPVDPLDASVREAERRLRSVLRPDDSIAIVEGDRLAVVLGHLGEPHVAVSIAEQIRGALRSSGHDGEVLSASVGIAYGWRDGDDTPADLLLHAKQALAVAQQRGPDQHEIFDDELREGLNERLRVRDELYAAIDAEEFRLHYQPTAILASGEITSIEALVRWQHPTRGLRSAVEFIDLAEDHGLILPLGAWVLNEACQQLHAWFGAFGEAAPVMSVNLSARQLLHPTAIDHVAGVLQAADVDPSHVCFEFSEQTLLHHDEDARIKLYALRDLGVNVAIDDFGAVCGPLSHLKRFPISEIKIDRSLVAGVPTSPGDSAMVAAIVDVGRALGIVVTASGVETGEQCAALQDLGCARGQGYYIARPQPPEKVAESLASIAPPGRARP